MARILALGNRSFVTALAGVGAEPMRCEGLKEFEENLRAAGLRKDVEIVFVPEPMAASSREAVEAFRRRSRASLLALPLRPSERHPSLEEMRRLVEQATGARLI